MAKYIITIATTISLTVLAYILLLRGQPLWCKLNDMTPWTVDVISPHNSQHFFDPYSFSHVLHGFLFVWIMSLVRINSKYFFLLGVVFETIWELLENSKFIIDRYRAATISLNYYGDSVANSVADVGCCMLGVYITKHLGFAKSFALFLIVEFSMISTMRDSLIINIIMLIYPLDSIRVWQSRL